MHAKINKRGVFSYKQALIKYISSNKFPAFKTSTFLLRHHEMFVFLPAEYRELLLNKSLLTLINTL